MKKSKHTEKIFKKIKPVIKSVQAFMELMRLNATDNKDQVRLYHLERHFVRGIIYSESEKYVNEKNPTKEGFVIDGYAIEECLKKIMIQHIKNNKKIDPEFRVPFAHEIDEEAKTWALLGLHPKIHETAISSYKKGIATLMNELAKLCMDKSLDFDAPAMQFIKKLFKW